LQIFSLLLRDETSGAATNCTPQLIPADIYQTIADALTLKLAKAQTQGNEQERGWAKQWLQFVGGRMPRKATKRVVMVVPYGGTMHSAQKYLMEWYDDAVAGGAEAIWPFDKFNPTMFLARQLWEVIQENIHSARACMAWFQEVSSICSEHGVPIRWTTPTGFPVKQDYKKFRTDMVETKVGEKVRRLSLRQDTETISPRRQRNGISPNFVHSLDATCLHRVVCRLHDSGVRDFAMIHDSYAVHAAHVPELNRVTREVYRDVFSSDLLNTFRAEVQAHLPSGVVLPDPPVAGTLNVEGLVDADYFFA
jgi:DNA-directed RNA polymerase